MDAPLATVTERDVKGLYLKAIAGEIAHFTGVSDPYEAPTAPDLHLRTDRLSVEQCLELLRPLAGLRTEVPA